LFNHGLKVIAYGALMHANLSFKMQSSIYFISMKTKKPLKIFCLFFAYMFFFKESGKGAFELAQKFP